MKHPPMPFVIAVAGVSFRQDIVRTCNPCDEIALVAVDDNPHDPDAIEVRTANGDQVGFVPAAIAARLRRTEARRWRAHITAVLQGDLWGLRVSVDAIEQPVPVGGRAVATREPGVQATSTGPAPSRAANQAAAPATPAGDVPTLAGNLVCSRAGRPLGVLVDCDDTVVTVQADDGLRTYPRHLTTVAH